MSPSYIERWSAAAYHGFTTQVPNVAYDGGLAGPGNITSQTGVGTYTYPLAGQPRPHAVTSLTGTFNGITNPSFVYDANGNMTSRAGSTVTWSSYNYPTDINANDATGAEEVQLSYGPDRQRWKQIYTAPGVTENTYYVGGLMEMVFSGGITNYRHYIYAGSEAIAVYSRTSSSVNSMSYMIEDHQGSISNIASNSGTSVVNESFSAFGARRNPTSWSGAPVSGDLNTIAGLSRQGYTFQTWLGQSMGLNHMNGRVEDAILGRFLSPDLHIPNPSDAQSYNRYSYVNNNPMSMVDPTGFKATSPCAVQGICWGDFHQGPLAGGGDGPVFGEDDFGEDQFGATGADLDGGYYSVYAGTSGGSTGTNGANVGGASGDNSNAGGAASGGTSNDPPAQSPPLDVGGTLDELNGDSALRAGSEALVCPDCESVTVTANAVASATMDVAGAGAAGVEAQFGERFLGSPNGGLYSRAWANRAGKAFKVSSLSKAFGIFGLAAGTAFDAQSLQDGDITGVQFGVNLGLGVLGYFVPLYAIGSMNALIINNFYPGGFQGYIASWTDGYGMPFNGGYDGLH